MIELHLLGFEVVREFVLLDMFAKREKRLLASSCLCVCGDTICPPEDEQRAARNMLRIVV